MYRFLIIIGLNFCLNHLCAQIVFKDDLDQMSFQAYMENDHQKLKSLLHIAEENDIDFYFLRVRAGIVGFNHHHYEFALEQFQNALKFWETDTLSKEYIYYCYLYTNRPDKAAIWAASQDAVFQKKVNYVPNNWNKIGLNSGVIITDNIENKKEEVYLPNDTSIRKSERTINGNIYFGEIFLQNTFKNKYHLYNSLSGYRTNSLSQIDARNGLMAFQSEKENKNLNLQYNLGMGISTQKEWNIGIGLGYYLVQSSSYTLLRPQQNLPPQLYSAKETQHNFLGSITIAKRFHNIEPFLHVSVSNLDKSRQSQFETGMTYYPLGNYNFYGQSSIAFLRQSSSNQYVITHSLGGKISSTWWMNTYFQYGNLHNYNSQNGYLTFNTSDPIILNAGFDFNFYIKKHFQIQTGYTFQKREGSQSNFSNTSPSTTPTIYYSTYNYFTHLIKTAFIWNF